MEKPGETRGSGEDVLRVFHAQPGARQRDYSGGARALGDRHSSTRS